MAKDKIEEEQPRQPNHYDTFGINRDDFAKMSSDEKKRALDEILEAKKDDPDIRELTKKADLLLNQDERVAYELDQELVPLDYYRTLGVASDANEKDLEAAFDSFQKKIRQEFTEDQKKHGTPKAVSLRQQKMALLTEMMKTLDGGNKEQYDKLVEENQSLSDQDFVLPGFESDPDIEIPALPGESADALDDKLETAYWPPVENMTTTEEVKEAIEEIQEEMLKLEDREVKCRKCKRLFTFGSKGDVVCPFCSELTPEKNRLNKLNKRREELQKDPEYKWKQEQIKTAELQLDNLLGILQKYAQQYKNEASKWPINQDKDRLEKIKESWDTNKWRYRDLAEDLNKENVKSAKIDSIKAEIERLIEIGQNVMELGAPVKNLEIAEDLDEYDSDLEDEKEGEPVDSGPGDYEYEAMDTTGGEVKGVIEDAGSEKHARWQIMAMGHFVTKLTLIKSKKRREIVWAKVKGWWKKNAPTWAGGGESPEEGEGEESAETEFSIKPGLSIPAEYRTEDQNSEYFDAEYSGSENDDTLLENPDKKLFGVFDGKGGGPLGNVASDMAAKSIDEKLSKLSDNASPGEIAVTIEIALEETNQEIVDLIESNPAKYTKEAKDGSIQGMGTSGSVVKLWEGKNGEKKAIIGNVGDTRVYKYHADGTLEQITLDDNLVRATAKTEVAARIKQEVFNNATSATDITIDTEDRELFRKRNGVTQELGKRGGITPRMHIVDLKKGDKIIILCDGISDNLTDNEMEKILNEGGNIQSLVNASVERSREPNPDGEGRPKQDDMTGIIIEVTAKKKSKTGTEDDKTTPTTEGATADTDEDEGEGEGEAAATTTAEADEEDNEEDETADDEEDEENTDDDSEEEESVDNGPGEYEYEALDSDGNDVKDTIDAESEKDAREQIEAKGLLINMLEMKKPRKKGAPTPRPKPKKAPAKDEEEDTDDEDEADEEESGKKSKKTKKQTEEEEEEERIAEQAEEELIKKEVEKERKRAKKTQREVLTKEKLKGKTPEDIQEVENFKEKLKEKIADTEEKIEKMEETEGEEIICSNCGTRFSLKSRRNGKCPKCETVAPKKKALDKLKKNLAEAKEDEHRIELNEIAIQQEAVAAALKEILEEEEELRKKEDRNWEKSSTREKAGILWRRGAALWWKAMKGWGFFTVGLTFLVSSLGADVGAKGGDYGVKDFSKTTNDLFGTDFGKKFFES